MRVLYSLSIRLAERKKQYRLVLLELLSLTVVFYFTLMFISKLVETQDEIRYYRERATSQAVVYQLAAEPEGAWPPGHGTLYRVARLYLTCEAGRYQVRVYGLDPHFSDFYHDGLFDKAPQASFFAEPKAIFAEDLARKMKLSPGDSITINGQALEVLATTADPWWKGKIAMASAFFPARNALTKEEIYLTLDASEGASHGPQLPILKEEKLGDAFQLEVQSLQSFQRFLAGFSTIFFLIAACNMTLILRSRFQRDLPIHRVMYVCGEGQKGFYLASALDYGLSAFLAYHAALLLYKLAQPLVPPFFYFSLSPRIYGQTLVSLMVLSLIMTLLMGRRERRFMRESWRGDHGI